MLGCLILKNLHREIEAFGLSYSLSILLISKMFAYPFLGATFLEDPKSLIYGNHSVQPYSLFFTKGLHHQSYIEEFTCGQVPEIPWYGAYLVYNFYIKRMHVLGL